MNLKMPSLNCEKRPSAAAQELAAPPATLTPVALAAAATAAQLERRLREVAAVVGFRAHIFIN